MVYTPLHYQVNQHVQTEFNQQVDSNHDFSTLYDHTFTDVRSFKQAMVDAHLTEPQQKVLLELALIEPIAVDFSQLPEGWTQGLSEERYHAVEQLDGAEFQHAWQLVDALSSASHEWQMAEDNIVNKQYNKRLKSDITTLLNHSYRH
ncbi:hypothetical protein JCM19233_90 [Vibrio astriarenae]|nr:hypothetical protein JCM19233_90 [Vibrio sp. C7]